MTEPQSKQDALAMPDQATHNVLVPQKSVLGRISKFHSITYNIINIDVADETYPIKGGNGAVGLHKSALNRIATAAGLRVVASGPMPGVPITPDHLIWQVEVEMDLGGAHPIRARGSKEWQKDIGVDGKDQEHRVSKTETKATLRAIRALLAIKSKYMPAELAKPIAVPHIMYDPDMSDEGVRAAVAGQKALAEAALYGTPAETLPEEWPEADADEVPEGCDPATGEVIEAEYEVIEEEPAASASVPDDGKELEYLGNRRIVSTKSALNGMSLLEIWDAEGRKWFAGIKAWAEANPTADIEKKQQLADVTRYLELRDAQGGEGL